MKQYFILAAIFMMAAFLFSCKQTVKQKESKVKSATSLTAVLEKSINIELRGTLRTRRSYADIQFMDNENEIDAYLDKQQKSNPELYAVFNKADSELVEQFKRFGFIKNYSFVLKKFKLQTKIKTSLLTDSGDTVFFKFYKDTAASKMCFKSFYKGDSVNVNTGTLSLQNLDYAFLDVIPGGNKELVFLDDYYIMNGDNFDFMVYEIKTRH